MSGGGSYTLLCPRCPPRCAWNPHKNCKKKERPLLVAPFSTDPPSSVGRWSSVFRPRRLVVGRPLVVGRRSSARVVGGWSSVVGRSTREFGRSIRNVAGRSETSPKKPTTNDRLPKICRLHAQKTDDQRPTPQNLSVTRPRGRNDVRPTTEARFGALVVGFVRWSLVESQKFPGRRSTKQLSLWRRSSLPRRTVGRHRT